jgi:trans-aconitate methyltransferase
MFIKYVTHLVKTSTTIPTSILDVACGCGTYFNLCKDNFPFLEYTGYDYSQNAVEVAKEKWGHDKFFVNDYRDLTTEKVREYDILHACSLHNVLPDGDEAMKFFLELSPKYMILGKVLTTHEQSNYDIYDAYGKIKTYMFKHNINTLESMFKDYNYTVYGDSKELPTNFLLIRGDNE